MREGLGRPSGARFGAAATEAGKSCFMQYWGREGGSRGGYISGQEEGGEEEDQAQEGSGLMKPDYAVSYSPP